MALAGKIGEWEISAGGMINDTNEAYLIQRHTFDDEKEAAIYIGTSILPSTTGLRAVARFVNQETNTIASGGTGTNHCVIIEASGADDNIAMDITGDIVQTSGKIKFNGLQTDGQDGESYIQVYKGASGDNYFTEFKNGIAVRHGEGTGI